MPTENLKRPGFLIPLVLGFTAVCLFLGFRLHHVQQENRELRQGLARLAEIEKKNGVVTHGSLTPDELESLRQASSPMVMWPVSFQADDGRAEKRRNRTVAKMPSARRLRSPDRVSAVMRISFIVP